MPPILATGVTSSGTTATFDAPSYGLTGTNKVAVGANQSQYDGVFTVASVVNANTFTVTLLTVAASPATGQIFVRRADSSTSAGTGSTPPTAAANRWS